MKRSRTTVGAILFWIAATACAFADSDAPGFNELKPRLQDRLAELTALVQEAERKGLVTDYAKVSVTVVKTFLKAAQHDYDHPDRVRRIFETFHHFSKIDPVHTDRIATTELVDALNVADHAIAELKRDLAGERALTAPPDLRMGGLTLKEAYYTQDGSPVFPSSLVWMPHTPELIDALGTLGGGYLQIAQLDSDLNRTKARNVARLKAQVESGVTPMVFLMGHGLANWMKDTHPELSHGGRNFTEYDIDHPAIRRWIKQMCEVFLPAYSKACGESPMVHLIANEPHFATAEKGWLSKNGLSEITIRKFHQWLRNKYGSLEKLNAAYGSDYQEFSDVKINRDLSRWYSGEEAYRGIQLDPALRGGPVWYDWCVYNMERVTAWFRYLKQQSQANDGGRNAPVSIKTLGFTLSRASRDGGMNLEDLTHLQDIVGADLRVVPAGAEFYGKHEEGIDPETGWQSRYAYDWMEQSMFLDFSKSVCPDKLFYDSEWHGFGAVSWRHYRISREYTRSAIWLAFTHGMGMIKPWLWGRSEGGALRGGADHIGELATQPVAVDAFGRVMKELNAHASSIVSLVPKERKIMIYYCEESAIQDETYTAGFKDIYEALKLLNASVGFATPSMLKQLDPKQQTLIVPPTPFIRNASLSRMTDYQQAGGQVVIVGGDRSFLKNELGQLRNPIRLPNSALEIPMNTVEDLTERFAPIAESNRPIVPFKVNVSDANGDPALGVIVNLAPESDGTWTLALNNVHRETRTVSIECKRLFDRIDGRSVQPEFRMAPCDVRLFKVTGN